MKLDNLTTYAENTWCPGCGNFPLFNAFQKSVEKLEKEHGIKRQELMMTAGIGCHAKIFDYLNLSGIYSLHGRGLANAQGIKFANPDLKVVSFSGDGDGLGEGIAHLIFAAKRNEDVTLVLHDNSTYALTTGQFAPTSDKGFKGPSSPYGSVEEPLNALSLMLEAGATFVAQGYVAKLNHLTDIFTQAVLHKGFSFVNVLQPCFTFLNTYPLYNEKAKIMEKAPKNYEEAVALAKVKEEFPLGVFYQTEKPVYHKSLYGDWHPIKDRLSKEKRREAVQALIK